MAETVNWALCACDILIGEEGSEELFGSTQGGQDVKWELETKVIEDDQHSTQLDEVVTGENFTIEFDSIEVVANSRFAQLLMGDLIVDGTDSTLTAIEFGGLVGQSLALTSTRVVLRPVKESLREKHTLIVKKGYIKPALDMNYSKEDPLKCHVTIVGLDPGDGTRPFRYGSPTAVAA